MYGGGSCLRLAVDRGDLAMAKSLHAAGGDALLRRESPDERTCLGRACELGHAELVPWLVEVGGDAELLARREGWVVPTPRYPKGFLAKYAKLAQGAELGAITR